MITKAAAVVVAAAASMMMAAVVMVVVAIVVTTIPVPLLNDGISTTEPYRRVEFETICHAVKTNSISKLRI